MHSFVKSNQKRLLWLHVGGKRVRADATIHPVRNPPKIRKEGKIIKKIK